MKCGEITVDGENKNTENTNPKRIHVLDKKVAELIAAGEVVERPASAVKELLENAIDAGASLITLEIKNGGVAFIRVTDNGCGILRSDVPAAFLRHATSKILREDDLSAIGTLGFRGEALASISAVSKTELITRTASELAGTQCRVEGGEVVETGDAGCPTGTTIIVRELFYNTPARMKFLKKDTTEANAVAAVAQRIALSHPEVSLRFIKEGREELHTPGDSKLISAVHAVLGREFANSLLPADYTFEHIRAHGFVTKPMASRPNRNFQFFFLNGRLIKSRTMMAALEEAYRGSMMTGKCPGCVLHLEVSPAAVDVNVHPAKLEVRFTNEREVFEAVYYAAKNALASDGERPVLDIDGAKNATLHGSLGMSAPYAAARASAAKTGSPEAGNHAAADFAARDYDGEREQLRLILESTPTAPESEPANAVRDPVRAAYEPVSSGKVDIPYEDSAAGAKLAAPQNGTSQPFFESREAESAGTDAAGKTVRTAGAIEVGGETPAVTVVGQCFGTYIIAQQGESLFIIDKHAAHERILYEQVKSRRQAASQVLLEPVAVKLPAEEYAAALEGLELLKEAGIAAEDFGGSTLLVREAPLDLAGQDVPALLSEVAGLLVAHKKDLTPARLDWIFHSVACRAAIKAHDRTTLPEMQDLASRVLGSDDIRYCPHGRPVAFELPKGELEKKFGR